MKNVPAGERYLFEEVGPHVYKSDAVRFDNAMHVAVETQWGRENPSRKANAGEAVLQIPADFQAGGWPGILDQRKSLAPAPAVYALVLGRKLGRLCGGSDILYIGQTGELGGSSEKCRLRIYRYPNGNHAKRLQNVTAILASANEKISFHWRYVTTKANAEAEESRLLNIYLKEHLELPPFNGRV